MLIFFIFFLIPLIFYILNVKYYKFQNIFYFLKFLFFNLIVMCYSVLNVLYCIIYFVFKNYRFFSYYYQIAKVSKFYYPKKSIYFLFWKYLTIFIVVNIYNFFVYLLYNIIVFFKKHIFINNIFIILLINSKVLLLSDNIKNILHFMYNLMIILCYHFFNLVNINWIYFFTKKINIFNRWGDIQDPFLKRNTYIKLTDFLNFWILKRYNKPQFFFNFSILNNLLKKYILSYIFLVIHNFDIKNIHILCLNIWIKQKYKMTKSTDVYNLLILCLFYINILLINFIYILLMFVLNIIHIIFYNLWKYKNYFIYIFIIIFCLKYYWCIHYYFLVLYKHYTLYLPIWQVKESFRFFNFEWIDLSNYYDLVLLRNALIDTSVFNNSLYNDLLNNLSQTLNLYGFKITPQYNIALYSALKNIYNKDTDLLNNMFKVFNDNKSGAQYQWYIRMRKIFNTKLKSVFHYYKQPKGLSRRNKRLSEYLYNRINLNTQNKDAQYTRHFIEKKFPMSQELKRKIGIYNYYTKGYYRKKISKKFAMLNLGHFLKIKKIPLRYTSVHSSDDFDKRFIFIFKWLLETTEKYKAVRAFHKKLKYGLNTLKKWTSYNDYKFFLGQFYSFSEYGLNTKSMVYKHKIPNFNWTISRWRRKIPNKSTIDFIYTSTIDTEHPFMTYRDVPRKKVFIKRNYKIRFIYLHYPFSINQYYDIERTVNYFGNNLKVLKKYYYIYNTKLYFNKRYYSTTLESNRVFIKQFLYRLSLIKKPLNKFYFHKSKKNTNFWFFFDYMKTDKYFHQKNQNIYGDQHYVNLYFIKRSRKSYIKLRNDLIRIYSLYFYYRNFERTNYKNWWPDTLSSFEQNLRNQDRFDSLRMVWFTYSYLTNDRTNVKLLKNIRILNYLFRENFMKYYIYCDNLNFHNIAYNEKIETYKLKVLNKVSNLKRFFYFQNKRNNGWSIFKYLNVFSIKYHIKHFIWHNPYSFLIYKNKLLYKAMDYKLNYIFSYFVNNEIMVCNKYSLIFNLYFNTFEINENVWNKNLLLINNELINYFNFGTYNYYNSSDIEIYRLIMNFIFNYYKNFLYRLLRYRYIIDYKNYTLLKFFKRYFNIVDWFYHSYFRFRWLIHKYIFFGNFIKKSYYKFFKFKYLYSYRVRRLAFMPFWFYFDDFTKIFIYIVLNKFYVKSYFLFYWFYVNYNFNLLYTCIFFYSFKFWLWNKITELKFNLLVLNFKEFKIDFKGLNLELVNLMNELLIYSNIKNEQLQQCFMYISDIFINIIYILNKYSIYLVELDYMLFLEMIKNSYFLCFKFISWILHYIQLNEIYIYLKWYIFILLNSYNDIWLNIIFNHNFNVFFKLYYFNINVQIILKIKNFIYIKYYLSKLIFYYLKIIFNIKNTLVYFKSNYYNYRQQKNLRYTTKFKTYFKSNFVSTRTVRNIYSFKHYTDNMIFLKNISFFNIYNYLYLMNNYDINLLNNSTNLLIIFKNQLIWYTILIYFLIYFFVYLLLFIIYRKFYNIFFFCKIINNDLQDNWCKIFHNKTSILLKNTSTKKLKYYNNLWKNKKWKNFYNFFSFNFFLDKNKIIQQLLFKIFIKSKIFNKIKQKFNNNYIIIIKESKFLLDFYTILYKIYDFMKLGNVKNIQVIKEKKPFNFYFYNLLNSNTFNFCFLYWFLIVPYFFFEYIWMRYHLKGHIRIKRKYFLFFKICLNNFKLYVQLSKLIGLNNYYTSHKRKSPRNYNNGSKYRKKRKLKLGYFFKWDRFSNSLVRLSSLGNYFYWFSHINKFEYFCSYKKYFFNCTYKSNYFYFIYIYIVFLIVKLFNFNKYKRCRI